MKAIVATRCPGCGLSASVAANPAGRSARSTSSLAGRRSGGPLDAGSTRPARWEPGATGAIGGLSSWGLVAAAGSFAAVALVTRICPARAVLSAASVAATDGPTTTSSREGEPTRKRWISPLWIPTDIDRWSRPTDVGASSA